MEGEGKTKHFILKLQNLPERKKKIIFFTVMLFIASIMVFFAVISTKYSILRMDESLRTIDFSRVENQRIDQGKRVVPNNSRGSQEEIPPR